MSGRSTIVAILLPLLAGCTLRRPLPVEPATGLPVLGAMNTETAGTGGTLASSSVLRVMCPSLDRAGTGFLHKSGHVVTAAHVVAGCPISDLKLLGISGKLTDVAKIESDEKLDLAWITPAKTLAGPTIPLNTATDLAVGLQVSTWGFPAGYRGIAPLLSVGYLAGSDVVTMPDGSSRLRLVVNAAFNSGNSGGPLISTEDGSVVGVVASKLAPLPPVVESALAALSEQRSGVIYQKRLPDGHTANVPEGQVVAEVLKYLRGQTQLVIGHAVPPADLRNFIKDHGADP